MHQSPYLSPITQNRQNGHTNKHELKTRTRVWLPETCTNQSMMIGVS